MLQKLHHITSLHNNHMLQKLHHITSFPEYSCKRFLCRHPAGLVEASILGRHIQIEVAISFLPLIHHLVFLYIPVTEPPHMELTLSTIRAPVTIPIVETPMRGIRILSDDRVSIA